MPETPSCTAALTEDSLFQGALLCRQYRQGYRFSVDAVLAAHFTIPEEDGDILDLGCGCGVISLILAHRYPRINLIGLELQEMLCALARHNAEENGFSSRVRLMHGDVRDIEQHLAPESCAMVVCNPPYRPAHGGRINQDKQAALARHELEGDIFDFARAAAFAVKNKGRAVFVYPAARGHVLLHALAARRLTPKRLRAVYSRPDGAEAELLLVEAVKNGGEQLAVLAPLYIYACDNGDYSPEMRAMYR